MGTTIAELDAFSPNFALLAPVISLALATTIFGFYLLLFGLSTYFLCKNRVVSYRELHFMWTTSLFFISTLGAFVIVSSGIQDAIVMYTALRTQNFAPFLLFSEHNETRTALEGIGYTCLIVTNCLADSVLIHRIYLVWGSKKWITVLPILASLVTNSVGLAGTIMRTKGFADTRIHANFVLEMKGVHFQLGFFYANAVVNLILTLMIAGRIWWVGRRTHASFSEIRIIHKKYKAIIAILLECGILYPIALIAHAFIEGNTDKISTPVDLMPTVIQLAGVVPTLILVRTCLGRSITEKIVDSQSTTSTFRFESKSENSKHLPSIVNVRSMTQTQSSLTPRASNNNLEVNIEQEKTSI